MDNGLIVSYLLGELKGPDREAFEERYFIDDSLFNQLQSVKHDLIDDYLQNRLPEAQRKQFEQHFGSNTHRWEQVELVRVLGKALEVHRPLSTRRTRSRQFFRHRLIAIGLATGLSLVLGVMISIYRENRSLREQVNAYKAVTAPVTSLPQSLSGALIDHLQLNASDLRISAGRSGHPPDTQVFRVHQDAAVVEITLVFPRPDLREFYTAVLLDADGVEHASVGQLSPTITDGMGQVTARFAAVYLSQGSYVIRLKTRRGDAVESFAFSLRVE